MSFPYLFKPKSQPRILITRHGPDYECVDCRPNMHSEIGLVSWFISSLSIVYNPIQLAITSLYTNQASNIYIYLVGGLEHGFYFSIFGNVIIPTDELHHFSEGVDIPPTRYRISNPIQSSIWSNLRPRQELTDLVDESFQRAIQARPISMKKWWGNHQKWWLSHPYMGNMVQFFLRLLSDWCADWWRPSNACPRWKSPQMNKVYRLKMIETYMFWNEQSLETSNWRCGQSICSNMKKIY